MGISLAHARYAQRKYDAMAVTLDYAVVGDRTFSLYFYHPDRTGEPCPLIFWIHGGAWKMGTKKDIEPGILRQLDRGFAIASVEYSLSGEAKWPTQIHELKAAVRYLRSHAQALSINPDCIIAAGMSAGGHLASMLGVTSGTSQLEGTLGCADQQSHVQGVVSWYGPSDLLRMGDLGVMDHNKANSPESQLIGAPIQTVPVQTQTANPMQYVHPDVPPFYLAHGTWDRFVNPNQSALLAECLRSNGTEVTYIPMPGYVHADFRFNKMAHLHCVESFLDGVRDQSKARVKVRNAT